VALYINISELCHNASIIFKKLNSLNFDMSYVYFKLKRKEKAQKLLERILKEYRGEIIGYDFEEHGVYPLSDPSVAVEIRDVSKRGGSLSITIPRSVCEYLDLHPGDQILFAVRKRIGKVCVDKVGQIYVKSPT